MQNQTRKGGSTHSTYKQGPRSRLARPGHGEREEHAGRGRSGAHRHLLVGLHAIEHHLDDLPAQLDALLRAVLGVGQVEEGRTARHLNVLVVLVALEGCDDQLQETGYGLRLVLI